MFPYCSTIYFIATLIGAGMTLKLFSSWRVSKDENMGYFMKAIALATVYFFLSALPGAVVKNPSIAAYLYILGWIPFYLTFFYFTRLAFHFLALERIKKFFSATIIFLIVFTTVFSFVYFSPTEIKVYKNFSFCFERSPSWILNFSGIVITLLLLLNSILFLRGSIMSREKIVRTRGLAIGAGLVLLTISSFFKYVLAPHWQEAQFFTFVAGPFLFLGIMVVYFGIQYKGNEKEVGDKK